MWVFFFTIIVRSLWITMIWHSVIRNAYCVMLHYPEHDYIQTLSGPSSPRDVTDLVTILSSFWRDKHLVTRLINYVSLINVGGNYSSPVCVLVILFACSRYLIVFLYICLCFFTRSEDKIVLFFVSLSCIVWTFTCTCIILLFRWHQYFFFF